MHNSRAVRHCDIIVTGNKMTLFILLFRRLARTCKQRLIFPVFQALSGKGFQHLVSGLSFLRQLSQHRVKQCLRHVIDAAVRSLHLAIRLLRMHAERHVGGQGPGSRGPGKEKCLLPHTLEAHDSRTLLHRLIALSHLMAGEGRATTGAIGNDLKALVQEPLIPDGLQRPPLGLNKIVAVGDIRVIHVRPEAHCGGEILPHPLVFPHALLTLVNKGRKPVFLNLLLAVQAKKLLHLQLHRQPVGVPARLAAHEPALHGLIPGEHVLKGPGLQVADMWLAVGGGGAVEEGIGGAPLPYLYALFKYPPVRPELLRGLLPLHEVHIRRDLSVLAHSPSSFQIVIQKNKPPPRNGTKEAFDIPPIYAIHQ